MPDRRLIAIVTGLMLIVGSLAARAAEPTLDQLRVIDALLTRNDTRGLLAFLEQNPDLLLGEDELSAELRRFATTVSGGRLRVDFVAAPPLEQRDGVVSRGAAFPGIY
ncbi:hypothetical protein [Rhodovulum euryhalinum]|uniref:Uncharacterized protein n=1 Tax=Rhodovulum euryhalinum TaxID=35805 RepID=A0A4R2KJR1_9RHOB|nr:hypothetical protein [Rhodovulum euryhalinum]TCO70826.1 hypothetical protein EV655_10867 [Rhodovulum euryhalinum]